MSRERRREGRLPFQDQLILHSYEEYGGKKKAFILVPFTPPLSEHFLVLLRNTWYQGPLLHWKLTDFALSQSPTMHEEVVQPAERDRKAFREPRIFCLVVFLRLWSRKVSFSFFLQGLLLHKTQLYLTVHQSITKIFHSKLVLWWPGKQMNCHFTINSHHTRMWILLKPRFLYVRETNGQEVKSLQVLISYIWTRKRKYHMRLTVTISFAHSTSER